MARWFSMRAGSRRQLVHHARGRGPGDRPAIPSDVVIPVMYPEMIRVIRRIADAGTRRFTYQERYVVLPATRVKPPVRGWLRIPSMHQMLSNQHDRCSTSCPLSAAAVDPDGGRVVPGAFLRRSHVPM